VRGRRVGFPSGRISRPDSLRALRWSGEAHPRPALPSTSETKPGPAGSHSLRTGVNAPACADLPANPLRNR
ncbi:hypothetical protein J4G37_19640, partial [Microvirga sp. 3-52]|nr:hypothetical protein [Microvirga sp. 3-52]